MSLGDLRRNKKTGSFQMVLNYYILSSVKVRVDSEELQKSSCAGCPSDKRAVEM